MPEAEQGTPLPSWQRWPPNCCESCTGWEKLENEQWVGRCASSVSLDCGDKTDSRYRCPSFQRKDGV